MIRGGFKYARYQPAPEKINRSFHLDNLYLGAGKGEVAQLVQSSCLTSNWSQVRSLSSLRNLIPNEPWNDMETGVQGKIGYELPARERGEIAVVHSITALFYYFKKTFS